MSGRNGCWEKNEKKRGKIITKLSKNAFREVQKSKIFSPRARGHPFPWTPSSVALALWASAHKLGPAGQGSWFAALALQRSGAYCTILVEYFYGNGSPFFFRQCQMTSTPQNFIKNFIFMPQFSPGNVKWPQVTSKWL